MKKGSRPDELRILMGWIERSRRALLETDSDCGEGSDEDVGKH